MTLEQLIAMGVPALRAMQFVDPLRATMALFAIDSAMRQAAFLAQCIHESGAFAHLEEDLYYRRPERIKAIWPSRVKTLDQAKALCCKPEALANVVYAGRNGNTQPGDGWKFRGRGLLQITGRAQYQLAEDETGLPFTAAPDQVAEPPAACMTAALYWQRNNLNAKADKGDIDGITRAINGPGMVAAEEREDQYHRCLSILIGNNYH